MPVHVIKDLKSKELIPGFTARMTTLDRVLFSHWTIKKGAMLPEHQHEHEQISILIKGQFEFYLEGERHLVQPGMVVMIPSDAVHSGKALEDCVIMDVFSPTREDYLALMKDD